MSNYNGILERMAEIEEDRELFMSSSGHVDEEDKSAFIMTLLRMNHELSEEKANIINTMKDTLKKSKFLLAEMEHART